MFGGPPIMSAPVFFPDAPSYPAPRYDYPPAPRAAPQAVWQQPAPQEQVPAVPAVPRAPIVRAKSDDEPLPEPVREQRPAVEERRPEPLNLPSPEELGVGCGCSHCRCEPCHCQAPVDWAEVHRRLDQLGALSFHQQKLLEGGYRVSFALPGSRSDRMHQVEATAPTEAQAVHLALQKAQELAQNK